MNEINICEKCGQKLLNNDNICINCDSKNSNSSQGKLILFVTGIIFIFFGIYPFTVLIISRFNVEYLDILGIIHLISYIFFIILGIFGIKYKENILKAKLLIYLSSFTIVLRIILVIIDVILELISSNNPLNLFLLISGLNFINNILYIKGALLNLETLKGKNTF